MNANKGKRNASSWDSDEIDSLNTTHKTHGSGFEINESILCLLSHELFE